MLRDISLCYSPFVKFDLFLSPRTHTTTRPARCPRSPILVSRRGIQAISLRQLANLPDDLVKATSDYGFLPALNRIMNHPESCVLHCSQLPDLGVDTGFLMASSLPLCGCVEAC